MELENFDDFGADLCPAPETSLDSDIDIGQVNCSSSGKKDEAVPRYAIAWEDSWEGFLEFIYSVKLVGDASILLKMTFSFL